jgi:hypothetical protein
VLHNLSKEEAQLATDRRTAIAQEDAADRNLGTRLPRVDLPQISGASAG